jgi:hypothetical protein
MQNLDKLPKASAVEMCCLLDSDAEAEEMVIFELVVPKAAKVPPPRQRVEVAKLVVQQASVTSTVPRTIITQLRANDTAQTTAWCITVALVVPQSQLLAVG